MLTRLTIATMLTCGAAAVAYAQAAPQQSAAPPSKPAASTTSKDAPAASADVGKLLGRNIQNAQNETIGEIESIYVDKEGRVAGVIVGVGGFLGMGEREVRIAWSDLAISQNGEKVTVNMTKDQLKVLPEYRYPDRRWRGQVFSERGPWTPERSRDMAARPDWGNFNAKGHLSSSAIVGATVRNQDREIVGEVEEIYIDNNGAIKEVIVSVGGFLGIGEKNVAVKWSDVQFAREGDDVVVKSTWTKDTLKTMPDYKRDQASTKK
jgi:sporulation protein YlmC with PRC-barrel domain